MSLSHQEWVTVSEAIDPNLKKLAIQFLSGDESAYRPMLDAAMENCKGGEQISPRYVQLLEDLLRDTKRLFHEAEQYDYHLHIHCDDHTTFSYRYHTLERHAKSLNRQGLS